VTFDIAFVPPGGGETDYGATVVTASRVPQPGEYIMVADPDQEGYWRAFKVLYVTSHYKYTSPSDGECKELGVTVQAEFIHHAEESESHRNAVNVYAGRGRGKKPEDYPTSGY